MDGIIHAPISLQELCDAVTQEIEGYVGFSPQANIYPVFDNVHRTYAVVIVPHWPRQLPAEIVVMARVSRDLIVIEVDTTDKLLVDALIVNQHIPRKKIILAYAGEVLQDEQIGEDQSTIHG